MTGVSAQHSYEKGHKTAAMHSQWSDREDTTEAELSRFSAAVLVEQLIPYEQFNRCPVIERCLGDYLGLTAVSEHWQV